ncbi:hypothetical protein [Azospirillum endophyticum]
MAYDSNNMKPCDGPIVVPIKTSKIRMAIVMIVFVYPIVTILLYTLRSLANNWDIWHRTLVLTPITVVLIVFVVSPLIAKHFDWFLRPSERP